jgi:anti-anti-sigma regulatory factor
MYIEVCDIGAFRVVRVMDDLGNDSNLEDLKAAVREQMDNHAQNIALSFTRRTYFFSRLIAVMVQFLGFVKERNGIFAIVHADPNMRNMLTLVGIDKLIRAFADEQQLESSAF